MNTRRQAFMLAGALTATIFTAAVALAGVSHRSTPASVSASAPIVQVAQQPAPPAEQADD